MKFEMGPVRGPFSAVALGVVVASGFSICSAQADPAEVAREVVNGVIRDVVQSVRDRVQNITSARPGRPLPFSAERSNTSAIYDDAFGALGYARMPTKAVPAPQPVAPVWLYGVNLTGTGNQDRSSTDGITTTTNSFTLAGGGDVTKIGIFTASDAISFIVTGSGTWSHQSGVNSDTPGIAGTLVYINGGFSTDFTVGGLWTRSSVSSLGISTTATTDSVSYTDNLQYKFDLSNNWWVEPTIGFTYSTFTGGLGGVGGAIPGIGGIPGVGVIPVPGAVPSGGVSGHSWEVHGGARVGTDVLWNNVHVQPSLEGLAFSPFDSSPILPSTTILAVAGVPS